jgi:hypothetical protein
MREVDTIPKGLTSEKNKNLSESHKPPVNIGFFDENNF